MTKHRALITAILGMEKVADSIGPDDLCFLDKDAGKVADAMRIVSDHLYQWRKKLEKQSVRR